MRKHRKRQLEKLGVPEISGWQMDYLFYFQANYIVAGLKMFYRMKRYTVPVPILDRHFEAHGIALRKGTPWRKNATDAELAIEQEAMKEWDEILRDMIWSFDQFAREVDKDLVIETQFGGSRKDYFQKINRGLKLYAEYFYELMDVKPGQVREIDTSTEAGKAELEALKAKIPKE